MYMITIKFYPKKYKQKKEKHYKGCIKKFLNLPSQEKSF